MRQNTNEEQILVRDAQKKWICFTFPEAKILRLFKSLWAHLILFCDGFYLKKETSALQWDVILSEFKIIYTYVHISYIQNWVSWDTRDKYIYLYFCEHIYIYIKNTYIFLWAYLSSQGHITEKPINNSSK